VTDSVVDYWPLSDGEVHAFFWFMQGSIMVPETRKRLWGAWGFCERHAWGHLAVEAAFRPRFLMGPATLYVDLMERALRCCPPRATPRHLGRCLANRVPCMMCEMNVRAAGSGAAPPARIERGRGVENLRALLVETRPHWQHAMCGPSSGSPTTLRCRLHLLHDLRFMSATEIGAQLRLLIDIQRHLEVYDRSFVWEHRNSADPEDRAALFAAVGWLSSWRPALALLNG
jgi:hypothetical protein